MKKMKLMIVLLIGLALVTIPLASAYAQSKGGTLKVIASRATKALGAPWEADNWFNIYGAHAMDALVQLDKAGNIVPNLAESWKVASDGLSITFKLRKGVKFHDGTDLDAAAAKISLDNMKRGTWPRRRKSVEVVDKYTVKLNLKQYDASIFGALSTKMGMIASPTAIAKKATPENQAKLHMVGTGPYKFVDWSRDEFIKFERNENYWRKGAYLDKLEITFIKDPVTSMLAFQSGAAQLTMRVTSKGANDLKAKGFEILSIPYGLKTLTPDGANPDSPFAKKKVREAIEYAIDRPAVAQAIGLGYWTPVSQACPYPDSIGYLKGVEGRKYDPAKAKKLLAEAGYPNGFKTRILSKAEENHDLLVALQTFLADIGIQAKLELLDRGRYVKNHKEGWNNGMMYGTIGARTYTVANNLGIITSTMPYNKPVYLPPGFEDTFDKALGTWDPDEERKHTQKLYRTVHDEAMIIPLWLETQLGAKTKEVHDSGWCEVGSTVWYSDKAWLSKK
ncbi:ABC transporter substrate-binding protein [Thermodesulfobacteriota bacterium]